MKPSHVLVHCLVVVSALSCEKPTLAGVDAYAIDFLENQTVSGFRVVDDEISNPDFTLTFQTLPHSRTKDDGFVPIGETWFVPVTRFDDPRISVSSTEIDPASLKLLDDVTLPEKALAVEGRYPGDPAYPFRGKIGWRISSPSGKSIPVALSRWLASKKVPSFKKDPGLSWLFLAGDVMPGRGIEGILGQGETGIEEVFGGTLPYLRNAEFGLCNVEGAITGAGTPEPKSYTFRHAPETFGALRAAGFNYFSFANNHVWDYGKDGFLDMLNTLPDRDAITSGIGENLFEAVRPARISVKENALSVLSVGAYPRERNGFDGQLKSSAGIFSPGILWSTPALPGLIGAAFSGSLDFDVVSIHGGTEWSNRPSAEFEDLCGVLAEAGADLIVGHHPHIVQGIGMKGNTLVFYSLGNFLFPGMDDTPGGTRGAFAMVALRKGRIVYIETRPLSLTWTGTDLAR